METDGLAGMCLERTEADLVASSYCGYGESLGELKACAREMIGKGALAQEGLLWWECSWSTNHLQHRRQSEYSICGEGSHI